MPICQPLTSIDFSRILSLRIPEIRQIWTQKYPSVLSFTSSSYMQLFLFLDLVKRKYGVYFSNARICKTTSPRPQFHESTRRGKPLQPYTRTGKFLYYPTRSFHSEYVHLECKTFSLFNTQLYYSKIEAFLKNFSSRTK